MRQERGGDEQSSMVLTQALGVGWGVSTSSEMGL